MDISSVNNLAASAGVPSGPTPLQPLSADQRTLIHAVKAVNAADLFGPENELSYTLDRNARQVVVRIVNRQTHEVVDQLPPESVLRMAEEMEGRENSTSENGE